MILHHDPFFSIFFGDARLSFTPAQWHGIEQAKLISEKPFSIVQKRMQLQQLIFLHQIHSAQGICINSTQQAQHIFPFGQDGDFLITHQQQIGLGIATADCLPILLYDTFNHVIGSVHAGWRGSMQKVVIHAIERMQQIYGTLVEHIKVFFGPCAKSCCYKIGPEVVAYLEHFSYATPVVYTINNQLFFDLPLFNRLQLEEIGIKKDSIQLHYNVCTICNESFCSYRRNNSLAQRQMTIIALK